MGAGAQVVGKLTANGQSLKLPKSKAVSSTVSSSPAGGGSLVYNVSIDFTRINKASFPTSVYTLSQSNGTEHISPGETKPIKQDINVSPTLPPPFIRPNRVMFKLQLNYGPDGVLFSPPQLFQIENPVTFAKLSKDLHEFRDRAEAWRTMVLQVDLTK